MPPFIPCIIYDNVYHSEMVVVAVWEFRVDLSAKLGLKELAMFYINILITCCIFNVSEYLEPNFSTLMLSMHANFKLPHSHMPGDVGLTCASFIRILETRISNDIDTKWWNVITSPCPKHQ